MSMEKKYQIFISSTYEDLREEREAVLRTVLEMGDFPVGMELFSAADEQQWQIISKEILQSDYYVVIVAHQYGSTLPDGISYTEKKYNFAVDNEIPVLGFIIADGVRWDPNKMESDPAMKAALERFKMEMKGRLVDHWNSPDDLAKTVAVSLMKQKNARPRPGWVRNIGVAGPEVTNELSRLSAQNNELRERLEKAENKEFKDTVSARQDVINILKINNISVHYWYKEATDWSTGIEKTLFYLFEILGPELQIEKSTDEALTFFASMSNWDRAKDLRVESPIPNNLFKTWLADLAVFDLIEPSSIRHPVTEKKQYWVLSDEGREVLKLIRRANLKTGEREAMAAPSSDPATKTPE